MPKQRLIVTLTPHCLEKLARGPEVLDFPELEIELRMASFSPNVVPVGLEGEGAYYQMAEVANA
jgi:hypothetical protein